MQLLLFFTVEVPVFLACMRARRCPGLFRIQAPPGDVPASQCTSSRAPYASIFASLLQLFLFFLVQLPIYDRHNQFAPETVRKNGVVPRFLLVNWHIAKEKYDQGLIFSRP